MDVEAQKRAKQGQREKYAKWPSEVRTLSANSGGDVFEGSRALVLSDGRRVPIYWRSKKGRGFWVGCKDYPLYFGPTLHDATLRLTQILESRALDSKASNDDNLLSLTS